MISFPFQNEETLPIHDTHNEKHSIQTLVNSQPLDQTPFIAPFVPCNLEIIKQSFDFAEIQPHDILMDLGCGDGRILVSALEMCHVKQVIGIELDPHLIEFIQKKHAHWIESNRFILVQKDMFHVDLNEWMDSTVMILYLLPIGLEKLKGILSNWLKENQKRRIVTITYSIPDWNPIKAKNIHLQGKKMEYWLFYYNLLSI